MKNSPWHVASGKCKLKQVTTTQLSEWPKLGTLTTSRAGEDVEWQNLPVYAGGNAK